VTILVPGLPLGGMTPTVYAISSTSTGWVMSKKSVAADTAAPLWGAPAQKNHDAGGPKPWQIVTKATSGTDDVAQG
jgi:hypothetical protein